MSDALFFIHGFNETCADVAARHGAIVDGLSTNGGFRPTVIGFDWPSAGIAFAYLPDLDVAAKTAIDLVNAGVRPMLTAKTKDCKVTVHALAHSIGAFVLRAALGHADDGITTGTSWMLGQLALVAGDVEASAFGGGDRVGNSTLPNERHQSGLHAAAVLAVAGQIIFQEFLLIEQPPNKRRRERNEYGQSPPRSK